MNLIEFVGPPGAGKSFFYKKLINKLQIKSIKTTNPLNLLIDSYYRKSSIKPSIKQKLYFVYVRYLKLNSNFLFKKNSTQFINFLNKEISNSKKFDLINKYYREYSADSPLRHGRRGAIDGLNPCCMEYLASTAFCSKTESEPFNFPSNALYDRGLKLFAGTVANLL